MRALITPSSDARISHHHHLVIRHGCTQIRNRCTFTTFVIPRKRPRHFVLLAQNLTDMSSPSRLSVPELLLACVSAAVACRGYRRCLRPRLFYRILRDSRARFRTCFFPFLSRANPCTFCRRRCRFVGARSRRMDPRFKIQDFPESSWIHENGSKIQDSRFPRKFLDP